MAKQSKSTPRLSLANKRARRAAMAAEYRAGGVTQEAIAQRYGVSRRTVTLALEAERQESEASVTPPPAPAPLVHSDGTPTTKNERSQAALGNKMSPERVKLVMDMLTGTAEFPPSTVSEIERRVRREWGLSARQARRYIQLGRRKLATLFEGEDSGAIRAQTDAMLLDAFATAKAKKDPHGQVLAAQRRAELHGVFAQKVNIAATVTGLADLLNELPEEGPREPGPTQPGSART